MKNKQSGNKCDLQGHFAVRNQAGNTLQSTRNIISATGRLPSGKFSPVKSSKSDTFVCRKEG